MDELVNASIICHQCMHLINSGIYIPGTKDTIIVSKSVLFGYIIDKRNLDFFSPSYQTRPHYLEVNGVHFLFTCSMNQVQFYLYLPGPQFIKNDNQIWNFDEYKEAIYWSLPPEQYNTPILMISSIPVWIEKNCLSIDIKFTGMNLCVLCFSIINKVIDQAKCLTVTGAEIHITCTWLYNDGFGTFSIIHV